MDIKIPEKFKILFWDYDLHGLDMLSHVDFIIERILEKGNFEAIRWLIKVYSMDLIQQVIVKSSNISVNTRNFWQMYFANYDQTG